MAHAITVTEATEAKPKTTRKPRKAAAKSNRSTTAKAATVSVETDDTGEQTVILTDEQGRSFKSRWFGKPLSMGGMYVVAGFDGVRKVTAPIGFIATSSAHVAERYLDRHPYQKKILVYTAEIFAIIVAFLIATFGIELILSALGLAL